MWHFFGQLEACLLNLSQVWFLFWCRPDPESTDSFDTSWNLLQNVAKMITCCSWWRVWIMICIIRSSWAAYLPHDVCFVLVELCTGEATLLQLPLLQLHTWCLLSKRWTQIAMAWSRERSSKMQLQARGANSRLQSSNSRFNSLLFEVSFTVKMKNVQKWREVFSIYELVRFLSGWQIADLAVQTQSLVCSLWIQSFFPTRHGLCSSTWNCKAGGVWYFHVLYSHAVSWTLAIQTRCNQVIKCKCV